MRLALVVGEASGDTHAAALAKALLEKLPELKIYAVAGPKLRALGVEEIFPMEKLQVMGFSDVLSSLFQIGKAFFSIQKRLLDLSLDAIVCVDYAEFNLRLETTLRKKGYRGKLIHYICPSVWAWRKGRKKTLENSVDLLLSILPFEPSYFAESSLPVTYIGHPLASMPIETLPREPLLAIFPGSRKKEIERNLPLQLAAASQFSFPVAISIAHENLLAPIQEIVKHTPHPVSLIPPEETKNLMKKASLAIATSGTVTLELALCETPTVVTYAIRPLDQWIAQKIFKINLPYYCLVNLLGNKEIFPELFGHHLTHENLTIAIEKALDRAPHILEECRKVRTILGEKEASQEAARIIKELLVDSPRLQKKR